MTEVMTMKKILQSAKKEDVNLLSLADAIHEYLQDSSCAIACDDGDGRFVSMGAVNHSMRILTQAIEKYKINHQPFN